MHYTYDQCKDLNTGPWTNGSCFWSIDYFKSYIFTRKLFEPQYYPNSKVFKIFDKYFGKYEARNLSEVRDRLDYFWIPCIFSQISGHQHLYFRWDEAKKSYLWQSCLHTEFHKFDQMYRVSKNNPTSEPFQFKFYLQGVPNPKRLLLLYSSEFSVVTATLEVQMSTQDAVILKHGCGYNQKDLFI